MNISVKKLENKIKNEDGFLNKLQNDTDKALTEVVNPTQDIGVYKFVLLFVGLSLMISLVAALWISLSDGLVISNADGSGKLTVEREVNQIFVMIGSAAIGALAGILVPRSATSPEDF